MCGIGGHHFCQVDGTQNNKVDREVVMISKMGREDLLAGQPKTDGWAAGYSVVSGGRVHHHLIFNQNFKGFMQRCSCHLRHFKNHELRNVAVFRSSGSRQHCLESTSTPTIETILHCLVNSQPFTTATSMSNCRRWIPTLQLGVPEARRRPVCMTTHHLSVSLHVVFILPHCGFDSLTRPLTPSQRIRAQYESLIGPNGTSSGASP